MSFADEGEWESFFGRDHLLPAVTPEAVSKALLGFPLPLADGRDMDWLAMAVRRMLALTLPSADEGPDRKSNADIRDEIAGLAQLAGSTWLALFNCDPAADYRLWRYSLQCWDGEGGTDIGDGLVIGDPSDYKRYKAAVAELDWLAGFLSRAASAIHVPRKQWKNPERRELRIERGQFLAPVFEAAFGQAVSANNYSKNGGDARHRAPTPFMDFYQRMVTLAFGEEATPNLSGVLKAACRRHGQNPVQLVAG